MVRVRSLRSGSALLATASALATCLLVPDSASTQPPLAGDYQFQDTHASSVPGVQDIANVGTGNTFVTETVGCKPARVLSFPKGSGVELQDPTTSASFYSIVVLFRLADLSGYRRIFTPSYPDASFATENGLYQLDGRLAIYDNTSPGNPFLGPTAVFASNTYAEVAFTYGVGQVASYVNGVQQSTYGGTSAHLARSMRFFRDNETGSYTEEESAGGVARIRIYYGPLTADEVSAIHAASPIAGACDPARRATAAVNGKVKVKRAGKGRFVVLTGIDVSCPELGAACDGSALIRRGGASAEQARISKAPKRLGKKKFSVAAGKTEQVRVKLTRKASNTLRSKGKLKGKISVKLAPPGTPAAVASRNATLKPPKPKHSES